MKRIQRNEAVRALRKTIAGGIYSNDRGIDCSMRMLDFSVITGSVIVKECGWRIITDTIPNVNLAEQSGGARMSWGTPLWPIFKITGPRPRFWPVSTAAAAFNEWRALGGTDAADWNPHARAEPPGPVLSVA